MPKIKSLRTKAAKHQAAPKLHTQTDEDGAPALTDPLPFSEVVEADGILTKKEKRMHKREVFQEYVADTLEKSVHSKSAKRRAKRRENERLAADMSDMGAILKTVLQDQPLPQGMQTGNTATSSSAIASAKQRSSKSRDERGRIGESTRAKPLTKQQKKQALKLEQKRLPLILSHPQFMKDSFGTIRTHTANVLARATSTKES